ncbi:Cupredoxin [Coniochaeta sp. 2T2.1]|nr:Cupredoxin [Coniochaeta sp. 2T2.1]
MVKPCIVSLLALSSSLSSVAAQLQPRCINTDTSRACWGNFSINTDYYATTPDTGVTREYWLSAESGLCAPDGYQRTCKTFNGTIPGPAIIADWGDNVVVHVTNNLPDNGTTVHWHGLRMLNTNEFDGVPGVTQCPIAPGHTILQYGDGLFGPIILNGPATADYDVDLGAVFLQDWDHTDIFTLWHEAKQTGSAPPMDTGLINGTNVWDCSNTDDPACVGGGKKFEVVFEPGKKYRMRLISSVIEGHFQFTIDNHNLTVIANDLVPIVPYTTDSVFISAGQRYDLIVEAAAEPGDYWLRAGWAAFCSATNMNPLNMTGIVRYDVSSQEDPTSGPTAIRRNGCGDEPIENQVPHLPVDVTSMPTIITEVLNNTLTGDDTNPFFRWTLNSSSLMLDWSNPTLQTVLSGESLFPTGYNIVDVDHQTTSPEPEWVVLLIQDTKVMRVDHPIHLHGHDFLILYQSPQDTVWDGSTAHFNTANPARRDTATLMAAGYIALAFRLDNPGVWLCHCHLAWHASEGLSLEIVERKEDLRIGMSEESVEQSKQACGMWGSSLEVWPQDDSGI